MGDCKKITDSYTVLKFSGPALSIYENYVISRWVRSYRYANDYMKLVDPASYYEAYGLYTRKILNSFTTIVRIAVLTDDTDVALGFSVSRKNILDYVHVHKDCRKQGIGKILIPPGIDTFTHLTRTGMKLWATHMPTVKFNPFA